MSGISWTLLAYAVAGCLLGGYALSIWVGYRLGQARREGAKTS